MTVRMKTVAAVALAAGVAMTSQQASADLLISNMPGNDGTQSADLSGGRIKAMGFTMPDTGPGYFLDSVTLRLNLFGLNVAPLIRIFDDVEGLPTNSLITLENPAISMSGIQNLDFTPGSQFALMPDTTYWLVVYDEGTDRLDWMANSPGIEPTGIASHAGSLFSTNTGPNPPTGSSGILNSYEIHGTLIPAPMSGAVLGLAAIGLVGRRRRND